MADETTGLMAAVDDEDGSVELDDLFDAEDAPVDPDTGVVADPDDEEGDEDDAEIADEGEPAAEPRPPTPAAKPAPKPAAAEDSALAEAERRGKAAEDAAAAADEPAPAPAPAKEPAAKPAAKPVADDDDAPEAGTRISGYLDIVKEAAEAGSVTLPDGRELNLSDFLETYGETADEIIAVAGLVAERIVAGKKGAGADSGAVAALQAEVSDLRFWGALERTMPEAREKAASKEFQAWLGTQSRGMQALANSPDPGDGLALLRAFDETSGKPRANAAAKARTKKDSRDALHAGTVRNRATAAQPARGGEGESEEELDELYASTNVMREPR